MTKNLTLLLIYLLLGLAVVNAQQVAQSPSPIRGFAGYEFGSGIDAIAADMETEGYTLIESNDGALWYNSELLGIDCELGYIFNRYRLVGGAMILRSATNQDFARVHEHLRKVYDAKVEMSVTPDTFVAVIAGPDARIVHTLNASKGIHEIEYTQE